MLKYIRAYHVIKLIQIPRKDIKGDVRDALRNKNGIMWENFPNGNPPSFGNVLYTNK